MCMFFSRIPRKRISMNGKAKNSVAKELGFHSKLYLNIEINDIQRIILIRTTLFIWLNNFYKNYMSL